MKRFLCVLIAISMLFALAACTEKDDSKVRVVTLKGPTGMGMVELFDSDSYEITLASTPDEARTAVIAGTCDIAALPVNLAALLYTKAGAQISLAAVNTLGVLYILENGNDITSLSDLRGKTVGASGQGSTPEYVLRYLLESAGIDPDTDVTIEYYTEHAELASKLISGDIDIGMLPEPNVSTVTGKNSDIRIALDLNTEWENATGTPLVQGCITVSDSFRSEHASLYEQFLTDYAASVEFVNSNPDEASVKIAAAGIIPSAETAKAAIPNCNICFYTGTQARGMLDPVLTRLMQANAASIGGALPDDGFYD